MIKLENTEVLGWGHAIRGMRNPMNSWEKSDSGCEHCFDSERDCDMCGYHIGRNDHDLMMRLAKGGPVHAKYRRMITVYVDITAPLYWWKEFDTYKVGTVANSCSTMHKIAAKEFTLEDFSHEHMLDVEGEAIEFNNAPGDYWNSIAVLDITVRVLNMYRQRYLETKDKKYWWQMIQLLPTSYNQKRTVMLNYEVLTGIYPSRKNHKLDEWHTFCDWIVGLPYSEIIVGERSDGTGMTESERTVRIGEKLHEGFKEGLEHLDPAIIDKWNSILERSHCVPEENWPTACNLCNEHGCGDSDEEVCKKCRFYQYSKWAKEENVGPNDGLNKHFGGYEE